MTPHSFREALVSRLSSAAAPIVLTAEQIDTLDKYWRMLERWNSRMNLTSLPLKDYPAQTVDRLIVEPLMAAGLLPAEPFDWYDLGSGGGSPALPLKVVTPAARLTMVESRSRKAAFLREVVRSMGLAATSRVRNDRFEAVAVEDVATADCVTVRAVRADEALSEATLRLIRPGGRLILFDSIQSAPELPGFYLINKVVLQDSPTVIRVLVPRGTKS